MKKIKLLIIFLFIFMFGGCYREESTMTINKDKSIDFEIKVLVEDKFNESIYVNNSEKYNLRKIKIQSITEYGHKGYKLTKHYDNIDEVSLEKKVDVELTKYVNPDFDDSVLFKVEKGFFRNKYTANFLIDKEYISKNLTIEKKETITQFINKVKGIYNKVLEEYGKNKEIVEYTNENLNIEGYEGIRLKLNIDEEGNVIYFEVSDLVYNYKNESEKIVNDDIISDYITEIEETNAVVTFVLNLPGKTISNNATKVNRDGKTLTWAYNEKDDINSIEFSFYLYNRSNIYKLFGLAILVIGGIAIVFFGYKKFIKSKKDKFEDENPICSDCDDSIKDVVSKGRRKIKTIDIKKRRRDNKIKKNNIEIIELDDL